MYFFSIGLYLCLHGFLYKPVKHLRARGNRKGWKINQQIVHRHAHTVCVFMLLLLLFTVSVFIWSIFYLFLLLRFPVKFLTDESVFLRVRPRFVCLVGGDVMWYIVLPRVSHYSFHWSTGSGYTPSCAALHHETHSTRLLDLKDTDSVCFGE